MSKERNFIFIEMVPKRLIKYTYSLLIIAPMWGIYISQFYVCISLHIRRTFGIHFMTIFFHPYLVWIVAGWSHRRRMEREAKAKVVASVWGGRIWSRKRVNSTVFSKSTEARNWTNFVSPHRRADLCLAFCPHPSSKGGPLHYNCGNVYDDSTDIYFLTYLLQKS